MSFTHGAELPHKTQAHRPAWLSSRSQWGWVTKPPNGCDPLSEVLTWVDSLTVPELEARREVTEKSWEAPVELQSRKYHMYL